MGEIFIQTDLLAMQVGTASAPAIFDVRDRAAYDADERVLPTAKWRDSRTVAHWAGALGGGRVVVYCAHGGVLSQGVAAELRACGVPAQALAGGMAAWRDRGGVTILRDAWPGRDETRPSHWVTRTLPKIDRIACPWLIRRFVDRDAVFMFVGPDQVRRVAETFDAIPFVVEGVDLSHDGERCSFDTFLTRFGLDGCGLERIAAIVRGADTGRPDLAPEAAGLLALSLGISALAADDHEALTRGFALYDALYAWQRHAAAEVHGWPPARTAA